MWYPTLFLNTFIFFWQTLRQNVTFVTIYSLIEEAFIYLICMVEIWKRHFLENVYWLRKYIKDYYITLLSYYYFTYIIYLFIVFKLSSVFIFTKYIIQKYVHDVHFNIRCVQKWRWTDTYICSYRNITILEVNQ